MNRKQKSKLQQQQEEEETFPCDETYEEVETNNNNSSTGGSYIQLQRVAPIDNVQEEYTDILDANLERATANKRSLLNASKPAVKPKPQAPGLGNEAAQARENAKQVSPEEQEPIEVNENDEDIYENYGEEVDEYYNHTPADNTGAGRTRGNHDTWSNDARYIQSTQHEEIESPYSNSSGSHHQEKDKRENVTPNVRGKASTLLPIRKVKKRVLGGCTVNRGCFIAFCTSFYKRKRVKYGALALVLGISLFILGFLSGWFGCKSSIKHKDFNRNYAATKYPKFFENRKDCLQSKFDLVLEVKDPDNIPSSNTEQKKRLQNALIQGSSLRLAYKEKSGNTWVFSDAMVAETVYNKQWHGNQPNTTDVLHSELCVQLYPSGNNHDIFIRTGSQVIRYAIVCTNGTVIQSTHSAVLLGEYKTLEDSVIHEYSNFTTSVQFFVRRSTAKLLNSNETYVSTEENLLLGKYIQSGNDFLLAGRHGNKTLAKYIATAAYLKFRDRKGSVQQQSFGIDIDSKETIFHLLTVNSNPDASDNNWYIQNVIHMITNNNNEKQVEALNTKWFVDECWNTVHQFSLSEVINKTLDLQQEKAMSNLEILVSSGHKVRLVVQTEQNTSVQLDLDTLVTKHHIIYGIHSWKSESVDTGVTWEWTIVSTSGHYIKRICRVWPVFKCQLQNGTFLKMKWTVDVHTWQVLYQNQVRPRATMNYGSFDHLLDKVLHGSPVKYMVHDVVNDVKFIYNTPLVSVKSNDEIIVEHFDEALLMWNANGLTFPLQSPQLYHKVSSSGTLWYNTLRIYKGMLQDSTNSLYSYLGRREYDINWFIQ